MIIGITGTTGAGKDTFAQYLVLKKRFCHISLSDIIREEAIGRGIELTRRNLQDLGNQMRQEFGRGIFAAKALGKIENNKNYAVTSIRNPGEIEILSKYEKFILCAVDAPQKQRFLRMAARPERDEKEPLTFEKFKKSEARELDSPDKANQQLLKCINMAKTKIANDKDLALFYKKIDKLLEKLKLVFSMNPDSF